MMTKTTLSDGRRTRPRFAAPTPTPPKFLIGTIDQSENHSTPSQQTTYPNPNGHKTRFSHPPQRIALCRISRPPSGLVPLAQPHPRKKTSGRGFIPSVNSRQTSSPPLAPIHPRNLGSPQRTRLPHPPRRIALSPWRNSASAMSRRFSSLVPLAQPHPRNAVTPLPAVPLYRWPPAGVFEVLATPRPLFGLLPLAQPHPRKPSGLSQSLDSTPFAQPHPRNAVTPLPAVFLYRWPPAGVLQALKTSGLLFGLIPFAQLHPRNEQSAQARSAETSKTPAGGRRYKNPSLACPGYRSAQAPRGNFFLVTRHLSLVTEISNRKYFAIFYSDFASISTRPLSAAAGGDPAEKTLHASAFAPHQAEEFAGVEVRGFVAEERFHAPLDIRRSPGTEAVAFGDDPVVAEGVQHVAEIGNGEIEIAERPVQRRLGGDDRIGAGAIDMHSIAS